MSTYDVYLQGKTAENTTGFASLTFGYDRTIAVRGPYKLVTQWLKRYLTTKGSDPLRPNDGTNFSSLIGSNITDLNDIRDVVMIAIQDCNSQIRLVQQQEPPDDDELLLDAVLTKIEKDGVDGFNAWVTITNAAGASLTATLPTATRA